MGTLVIYNVCTAYFCIKFSYKRLNINKYEKTRYLWQQNLKNVFGETSAKEHLNDSRQVTDDDFFSKIEYNFYTDCRYNVRRYA